MNQGILGLAMGFAGGASAPTMDPPTGLSVTHFDTGFDISTDFQWSAPSAVAPDQYDFTYNSNGIGLIHLVLPGDDLYEQVSDYYDAEWSISIIAQKTGYIDSTALTGSGQNPSSSYP